MDLIKLADALIPDKDVKPLDYYEEKYPLRNLPEGAQVTRLAPSPRALCISATFTLLWQTNVSPIKAAVCSI